MRNVGAQDLRDSEALRGQVATQLSRVQASLDAMLVDRPRRRILRNAPASGAELMKLLVKPDGTVRAIYDEAIDLGVLGRPTITRASHVEPDQEGRWLADLTPVGGPVLGPFDRRSEALEAERDWLERHWLPGDRLNRTSSHRSLHRGRRPAAPSSSPSRTSPTPGPAVPPPGARRPRGRCAPGVGGTGPGREGGHHDPHPA